MPFEQFLVYKNKIGKSPRNKISNSIKIPERTIVG